VESFSPKTCLNRQFELAMLRLPACTTQRRRAIQKLEETVARLPRASAVRVRRGPIGFARLHLCKALGGLLRSSAGQAQDSDF
jgi:hypothetical protein